MILHSFNQLSSQGDLNDARLEGFDHKLERLETYMKSMHLKSKNKTVFPDIHLNGIYFTFNILKVQKCSLFKPSTFEGYRKNISGSKQGIQDILFSPSLSSIMALTKQKVKRVS